MQILFFSFLFFLPAGIGNMTPIFVARLPLLRDYCYPLDFGMKFQGKRILGDHKTIRGLVCGVVVGAIFGVLIQITGIYGHTNSALLGGLLALGGLIGDSAKSFFKRRIGIAPGKSWFPYDQIDYTVGGLLFSAVIIRLSIAEYATIFFLYFFLHIITSYVGYLLKFKSTPI